MSAPNNGGAAFPGGGADAERHYFDPGMSLRDYFAATAIPALVPIASENAWRRGKLGEIAYSIADEMIAARETESSTSAHIPDLLGPLERLLEVIDVPEPNCSCHIAPPCHDCVELGGLREAVEEARAAIKKATPTPTTTP